MSLFSRKKKLITAGCSYTADYALSQGIEQFPPWPSLLAEKLDMECIDVSKIANGNKAIFSTVIDEVVSQKNIGLAIPMWSEFQRVSFYIGEVGISKQIADKDLWSCFHPDRDYLDGEWRDQFYDSPEKNTVKQDYVYKVSKVLRENGLNGLRGGTYDSIRMMYSFQTICENLDIPYLQVQGCLPIMSKTDNRGQKALCENILDSCYFDKMNKKTFLGWPIMPQISGFNIDHHLDLIDPDRTTLRISPEDTHPNGEAHEIISEVLYDKYNKIYS